MTFFDPKKMDIFGGTSQTTVDWVKKVATETNNPQVLDTIKKKEQEKIRDTMLGTNTSGNTTTQASAPKTATGTVGGTPQSASGNTQTTSKSGGTNTASAGTGGSTSKSNAAGTPVINPLAPKSNTPAYTDIAGQKDDAKTMGDQLGSGQSGTDGKSYLAESLDQLVRGNYSGDVTGLGTGLQVLSGILGLDTAADVRDLYYDVTHWDGSKEHIIQTLLDVVGLIPVVGAVKYADEVGALVKQGLKGADEAAATVAKTVDKQVYEWPAGYKPSPLITDEEAAMGIWEVPKSTKTSPYFTDDEIKYLLETEGQKPLSNAVEEVGETKIAGKSGTEYNGGERLIADLLDKSNKTLDTGRQLDNRPYLSPNNRPSFRKGIVETTWNQSKGPDGLVRDPNTGAIIHWTQGQSRKGIWDMGHIPEQKYYDIYKRYLQGEITPKQFREWYNNPNNYRPEIPHNNRGHLFE